MTAFLLAADRLPALGPFQVLTDAATLVWAAAAGRNARVTIAASRTLGAMTGMVAGDAGYLTIIQGGAGSFLITWNAQYVFNGATKPVLSTSVGAKDHFAWFYDGTNVVVTPFTLGAG